MKENVINKIPLRIYRYLRWLHGEIPTYRRIRADFNKDYADVCFQVDNAWRKQVPIEQYLAIREEKDTYILKYLRETYRDVLNKWKDRMPAVTRDNKQEKNIWVMWWQGEESAPDIVRACMKSIRRNANGHKVIFLDKTNYQEYVDIPASIVEKHDKGMIGHAHFSDIIRLTLLAKWGGAWIDATVFLSQPLPDIVFNNEFYTLKTYDPKSVFFSKSRWTSYFMAGDRASSLLTFARDCLVAYWEKNDAIIDYLLLDYVLDLACQEFEDMSQIIERVPENNFNRGLLMARINDPYDEKLFQNLSTNDTFASKLSWRYGNPQATTKDGRLTNYGFLLNL